MEGEARIEVMKGRSLYTFIFEFEGGTYVSQVEAQHPKKATRQWAAQLEIQQIPNFTQVMKENLKKSVEHEDATPVEGVTNVWFLVLRPSKDTFCQVNIVKTDDA